MNWMKKDCEQYREMISVLLDGELSESELLRLKNHLSQCDDCSTLCVAMAATDGAMSESFLDPPAPLHRDIMTRLRAQEAKRRRKYLRPMMAAAACLVVLVGAALIVPSALRMGRAESGAGASPAASSEAAASMAMEDPSEANGSTAPAAPAVAGGAAAEFAKTTSGADMEEYVIAESPETAEEGVAFDTANAAASQEAQPVPAPESAEQANEIDAGAVTETGTEPLFTLEVDVLGVEDGTLTGTVLSDPSGHLATGVTVLVTVPEEQAGDGAQAGDRVLVGFDSLAPIPEGWLVAARTIEVMS